MLQDVLNAIGMNSWIPAYRLDGGTEVKVAPAIFVNPVMNHAQIATIRLVDAKGTQFGAVTAAQVSAFFNFIESDETSFKASNYRKVKENKLWLATYDVEENVAWTYSKKTGKQIQMETVMACRKCGVMLPVRNLTIDHTVPQAADGNLAIARVFRGLGLTLGGPKGEKNKTAVQTYAATVGGLAKNVGSWTERYSLNEPGSIYYSMVKAANQLQDLRTRCLHNTLNLRPVCGPCNSSLGDKGFF
jgi:hypothetical protein